MLLPAPRPSRARASTGALGFPYPVSSAFPYDAAQWQTQEMGDWQPWLRSPDAEINQFRDRMVARQRDLVRNDGMATGAVAKILDATVGSRLRFRSQPDYRALRLATGIKGFDAKWANEFRQAAEALWRPYASATGRWNDLEREMTVPQQWRLGLRHKLVDGDALTLAYWLPERQGRAAARYATCFQVVDPDRLSNPNLAPDSRYMRGGKELDEDGVAIAAHIRKAEPNDWYNAAESMTWERVMIEDSDGWRRVVHDFDRERAGQHRGVGVFAPVLGRMKMLAGYYRYELQQAALQSSLGTYLTSPYDPAQVEDALIAGDAELSKYQSLRADWHRERPAMFNGVTVGSLAPGESVTTVGATHPHEGFEVFAHEMQAACASAVGVTLEQFNNNWKEMNYSNARGSFMDIWKTLIRRRHDFEDGTAQPMIACWLQEPMERGELPLPAGAPDYVEHRTEYSRAQFLGPARGWLDPVKEPQGAVLEMDAGMSTLSEEAGEQGRDWEEVLDQRQIEVQGFKDRGLDPPSWAAMNADQASRVPPPPQPA